MEDLRSTSSLIWAVMRKNLKLGWKRKKIRSIGMPLLIYLGIIILMYNLTKKAKAQGMIMSMILPIYLALSQMAVFQQLVIDGLEGKARRARYAVMVVANRYNAGTVAVTRLGQFVPGPGFGGADRITGGAVAPDCLATNIFKLLTGA